MSERVLWVRNGESEMDSLLDDSSMDDFELLLAGNLSETMEKSLLEKPDVIVAAVAPGGKMDGVDLIERLMEKPETAAIPVVFLSGDSEADLEIQCLRAGAYDFISKPFELDHIIDRIKTAAEFGREKRKRPSKAGFSGQLAGVDWANIVQFLEWNRKSGELVFRDKKRKKMGCLYFQDGVLVDARTRDFEGEEAFFALWGRMKGTFEFFNRREDYPVTIKSKNNALLMEAARLDDECREFFSLLPNANPVLHLKNEVAPLELLDKFGGETLYEIISVVVAKKNVKDVFGNANMSRIRAGSILYHMFRKNYLTIAADKII